jgi:acylphosphatase
MTRIVFTISGKRVQKVGYRLFLLKQMKERNLKGYAINLGDGVQVNVIAWGEKLTLALFYKEMRDKKPRKVGKISLNLATFDNESEPKNFFFLHEKTDLMLEQTLTFVEEGKKQMQS